MSRKNWTNEKVFYRLVNNRSESTYMDNIGELRSRPTKVTFEQCIQFLKSNDPKKRIIAIDIMAQLGKSPRPFLTETIPLFLELLASENKEMVIWSTLHALGHNNDDLNEIDIPRLTKFKEYKNTNIRLGLVHSLLGIEYKLAIDSLIYLSSDSQPSVRDWATFGLGTLIEVNNKKIREALWQRVKDPSGDIKFEALLGLAKRKDKRIYDTIHRELKDGEHGTLLFEAIEELNDKIFLPQLIENLKLSKMDNEINKSWIEALENCIMELQKEENKPAKKEN